MLATMERLAIRRYMTAAVEVEEAVSMRATAERCWPSFLSRERAHACWPSTLSLAHLAELGGGFAGVAMNEWAEAAADVAINELMGEMTARMQVETRERGAVGGGRL